MDELISAANIITFLPKLTFLNEKDPCISNVIPHLE